MPFVKRDGSNNIIGVYARPQADATEWVEAADGPEPSELHLRKEEAFAPLSGAKLDAITAYLANAAADDQHAQHAVAVQYQRKLFVQSTFNVKSTAWTSACDWLLAQSLIDQTDHDALTGV